MLSKPINPTKSKRQPKAGYLEKGPSRIIPKVVSNQLAEYIWDTCTWKTSDQYTGCFEPDDVSKCKYSVTLNDKTGYWIVLFCWKSFERIINLHTLFWIWNNRDIPPIHGQAMHVCHRKCSMHVTMGGKSHYSFF